MRFSALFVISTQGCLCILTFFGAERIKNTIFIMSCRLPFTHTVRLSHRSLTIHPKLSKFKWKKLASITKLDRYVSLFVLLSNDPVSLFETRLERWMFRKQEILTYFFHVSFQYIFLKCPKLSHLEWHPFTLTSVSYCIKTCGTLSNFIGQHDNH